MYAKAILNPHDYFESLYKRLPFSEYFCRTQKMEQLYHAF